MDELVRPAREAQHERAGAARLLFHADKALDLVRTAQRARAARAGSTQDRSPSASSPSRLPGLVRCGCTSSSTGSRASGWSCAEQPTDDLLDADTVSREPLAAAVEAVLGDTSIERTVTTIRGARSTAACGTCCSGRLDARFAWPPRSDDDVRAFEAQHGGGLPADHRGTDAMHATPSSVRRIRARAGSMSEAVMARSP